MLLYFFAFFNIMDIFYKKSLLKYFEKLKFFKMRNTIRVEGLFVVV